MHDGKRLDFEPDKTIERMVVFTPAMDFFMAHGALDEVSIPIQAWAGSFVDARFIDDGAGHFSFMNELPPNIVDTIDEREPFLTWVNLEVSKFIFG